MAAHSLLHHQCHPTCCCCLHVAATSSATPPPPASTPECFGPGMTINCHKLGQNSHQHACWQQLSRRASGSIAGYFGLPDLNPTLEKTDRGLTQEGMGLSGHGEVCHILPTAQKHESVICPNTMDPHPHPYVQYVSQV